MSDVSDRNLGKNKVDVRLIHFSSPLTLLNLPERVRIQRSSLYRPGPKLQNRWNFECVCVLGYRENHADGCGVASPLFILLAQLGNTRVLRQRLDLLKLLLYPLLERAGLSPHLVQALLQCRSRRFRTVRAPWSNNSSCITYRRESPFKILAANKVQKTQKAPNGVDSAVHAVQAIASFVPGSNVLFTERTKRTAKYPGSTSLALSLRSQGSTQLW